MEILLNIEEGILRFIGNSNPMRSFFILIISLIVAYYISKAVTFVIVKLAQFVAVRADNASSDEKVIQLRQVETYLSVAIAILRVLIVIGVGYVMWDIFSAQSSPSIAAIGASVIFLVIAGGTINPLLRDITAGSTMIVERWFTVGDFIRVEPFMDLGGVVERVTLRSTKLRSLNGEVVYLHNQHIQGVRRTPRGLRTIAVDVFVNNKESGEKLINKVIDTIPTGTLTVAQPLKITKSEKWGDDLWRVIVIGQTAPGREWLIENYFVDTINEMDNRARRKPLLVHKPIVRFADPGAERSFKRAVRIARDDAPSK